MEYIPLNIKNEDNNETILQTLINENKNNIEKEKEIILKNNQTRQNRITISNLIENTNANTNVTSSHHFLVNTILNNFTKKFNSNNPSDIIQSSLEYNNYLINQLIQNKDQISDDEFRLCMNILWENLRSLSTNADNFLKSQTLVKSYKYCEIYTDSKKRNGSDFVGRKRNEGGSNISGLTIVINKSVLEENTQIAENK